ncbi:MAG: methyl-accepting chemotaxis protein [Bacteroidales bacterium]
MNFKNIKIGNKLIIGFSSILLVAIVIGYIGYRGMKAIDVLHDEVSNDILPSIQSLLVISEAQSSIDGAENMLLANNLSLDLQNEAYKRFDSAKARADKAWKIYEPLHHDEKEAKILKESVIAWNEWWKHHENFIELEKKYNANKTVQNYNAMSDYALKTISVSFTKTEGLLNQLIIINDDISHESHVIANKQTNLAYSLLLIVIIFGAIISIVLGIIISRSIIIPLGKGVKLAESVAQGDLTIVIDIDQKDETGQLANALKNMVERLKILTSEIKNGVNVLGTSSSEILSTVTEISTGAAETATAVSETTTTVEEVRQTAMVSSQKAQYLMESSQKAADSVEKGRDSINSVIISMKKIDNQMSIISETILKLSEQNRTIGEITSTVADIADQSNLLAVNAAIEASKAGEHGRGFTVVAQEIRSLADQSKKATIQVKEILNEINKSVNQAVGVTEQGTKTVDEGRNLVALSGEVIELLSENVEETAQAAIQISSSNQQQMAGMEQIVPAMENIKQASEQNVAGIKQAQVAAHDLNNLGQNLKDIIEKFKL